MKKDKDIENLGYAIKKARENDEGVHSETENSSGISPLRVGSELVAGVIVGSGLGLLADHWLKTSPLFFIVFFFVGILASGFNIYRLAKGQKISDNADKNS